MTSAGSHQIPTYVWTFLALAVGLAAGGFFPGPLEPVADATSVLISWIVAVVPLLILATLSPAIATLVRRGLAGRFAGAVVLWYIFTSIVAKNRTTPNSVRAMNPFLSIFMPGFCSLTPQDRNIDGSNLGGTRRAASSRPGPHSVRQSDEGAPFSFVKMTNGSLRVRC